MPEIAATLTYRREAGRKLTAADRGKIKRFAAKVNLDVAQGRGFDCLFSDDRELRELNRAFLNHDYATDVLSFPSGEKFGLAGELAVSVDRAAAQAEEFGHSLVEELQILMVHGVLHLAGHDHEEDGGAMATEEERWRSEYGLPRGLIARVRTKPRTGGKR